MTQLPSNSPPAPRSEADLVQRLSSLCGTRIVVALPGERDAAPAAYLTDRADPAGARRAAAFLDQMMTPATPRKLAERLAMVTTVCIRRADMSDAQVVLWSECLKAVMAEYPADIALQTLDDWPKTDGGKWWPTENELRAECDARTELRKLIAKRLAEACSERQQPVIQGPDYSKTPIGPCALFAEAVRQSDERIFQTYLSGEKGSDAVYAERDIYLSLIGLSKLMPYGQLAAELGVRLHQRTTQEAHP